MHSKHLRTWLNAVISESGNRHRAACSAQGVRALFSRMPNDHAAARSFASKSRVPNARTKTVPPKAPITAALIAKLETPTAVLRAALDADAQCALASQELDLLMAWDDALRVAAKLATAILEDSLKDRLSKTVLAWRKRQEDYEALLKVDHMLHLALLAARMLCTAIPGFRLFIWVPEDYGVQIKQAEKQLLGELPLLTRTLDNPVTGAADWQGFSVPYVASGGWVAREISMQNTSRIYLASADRLARSVQRCGLQSNSGPSEDSPPWAAILLDSEELHEDAIWALLVLAADDDSCYAAMDAASELQFGVVEVEPDPMDLVEAVAHPCGLLIMGETLWW